MSINDYISAQDAARQPLLGAINNIILKNDGTVSATVGTLMGKEMILYNNRGSFKYGLSSVKDHISLHVLPIYGNSTLYQKYEQLLPGARFQKGCINFKAETDMPLEIVEQLMLDCSKIDMIAIREKYLAGKKK